MLRSIEDISATRKRVKIELPAEEIEKEIKDSLRDLQARLKLPGFRQGKVPIPLIEKRYGKDIETETIEKLISREYKNALKEAGLVPVTHPVVEEASEFKRNSPLSMTFTLEVRPNLDNLKYDGIVVKDITPKVEESDIENALKHLQMEKTVYEPSEAGISEKDIIITDIITTEDDSQVEIPSQVLNISLDYIPKEVFEALIGKEKGSECSVTASFPEDFFIPELAGSQKEVTFKIKEVKKPSIPQIDDEFAKDLGYESLDALKAKIEERILESIKAEIKRIHQAQIVKKLVDENEFEVPSSLLERRLEELLANARANSKGDFDENSEREKLKESAERQVKADLIIKAIGEHEKIDITPKDIEEKIVEIARRLRLSPENVTKYLVAKEGSMEIISNQVFEEKVLDLLYSKAKIEPAEEGK